MIKSKIKQEKGITMIALAVTVIILLIVTNILIYNAKDSIHIQALTNLYNDIELLQEKVSDYYNEYGQIPAEIQYTNISELLKSNILSKNNEQEYKFYVIDLEAMKGITLNYGKDYEKIRNNEENVNNYTDIYIINENSHNIFYVQGISIKENNQITTYYTDYKEPDETIIDLRYIDGITIPEGYYYIGKEKTDNSGNESIIISNMLPNSEKIENINEVQYIWEKKTYLMEIPQSIEIDEENKSKFLKSVNHYKGYFKNKDSNKTIYTDTDIIYLPIDENKWSEEYTKNEKYIDRNGDTAYIPKGFRVSLAEGTNEIREGLVITDKIDENNQSIGNEFVWVPVDYFEEFIREDFGENPIDETSFITTEKTEEKYYEPSGDGKKVDETAEENIKEAQEMYKSVKEYKGFYIGRYETGSDIKRTSSLDTSNAIIKKNQYIYNYVTCGNSIDEKAGAIEISRNMYDNSTLCYGVQWDAIIRWINKDNLLKNILKDSSEYGNYNNELQLIKSGNYEEYQTKNIYDLVGNVAEWTMESYGTKGNVARGGKSGNAEQTITYRDTVTTDDINNINLGLYGFRVALYIK